MARERGGEVVLLGTMIVERDKKIQELEHQLLYIDSKMLLKQYLLEQTKMKASNDRVDASNTAMDLSRKRREMRDKLKRRYIDIRVQNGGLHEYADCLKGGNPRVIGSSYTVRIQAQLCKAMHSMGILQHQLAIVKTSSNTVVQRFKDALNDMLDQKSQVEVDLMNQLMVVDSEKRKIEEDLMEEMQSSTSTPSNGHTSAVRPYSQPVYSPFDARVNNESDGEIAHMMLRQIVQRRRAVGEALVQENRKQQDRIKELEGAIKALDEKLKNSSV